MLRVPTARRSLDISMRMDSTTTGGGGSAGQDTVLAWFFAVISNALAWLTHGQNMSNVNHGIGIIAGLAALYISIRRIIRDRRKRG